jgi:hypothetical protein
MGDEGKAIADAENIKAARKEFEKLSSRAIETAKGHDGYYVANCPMLKKTGCRPRRNLQPLRRQLDADVRRNQEVTDRSATRPAKETTHKERHHHEIPISDRCSDGARRQCRRDFPVRG